MYSYDNQDEGHTYVFNICAPIPSSSSSGKCLPQGNTEVAEFGVATQFWGTPPSSSYMCQGGYGWTKTECTDSGGTWIKQCDSTAKAGPQCRVPPPFVPPTQTYAPTAAPTTNAPPWSQQLCDDCTAECKVLALAGDRAASPQWTVQDTQNVAGGINAMFQGVSSKTDNCPFNPYTLSNARTATYQFRCDPTATSTPNFHVGQRSVGQCSMEFSFGDGDGDADGDGDGDGGFNAGIGPATVLINGNWTYVDDICRTTWGHVDQTCCKMGCGNGCVGAPSFKTSATCVKAGGEWNPPCPTATQTLGAPVTVLAPATTQSPGPTGFFGPRFWNGCSDQWDTPLGCCDYDFHIGTSLACGAADISNAAQGRCSISSIHNAEACITAGGSWTNAAAKMSGGTIFAIVACSVLGAYILLGMAWNKHRGGRFAHPHARCAGDFIALCGEGVSWSLNGCHLVPKGAAQGYAGADGQNIGKGNVFMVSAKGGSQQRNEGNVSGLTANDAMVAQDDQETGYNSI